jgi:tRNA modification GTPase
MLSDTIVAVSSPPPGSTSSGGGIRAIIRLSGPAAWRLAREVVELPADARAGYHGELVVPLLHHSTRFASVLLFKGPRSFTGEDVAELHLPNSPALVRACVDRVLEAGSGDARLAGPGEFSARAFFNGKIDLTEAEGIAATINAHSAIELQAASHLRNGMLHRDISDLTERVATMLALVEAEIDFVDEEDVSFIDRDKLESQLEQLGGYLEELLMTSIRIDRCDAIPTAVFIGEPNVGKSSLINALVGKQRSIVSDVAGTTRDVLSAILHTRRGDIRLLDVPGNEIPSDELRTKMMDARRNALLEADLVVRVTDAPGELRDEDIQGSHDIPAQLLVVQNKADLLPPEVQARLVWEPGSGTQSAPVSAKTGLHIDQLRELITRLAGKKDSVGRNRRVLNQRHRLLLQEAKVALWDARRRAHFLKQPELLAADLRRALDLLGQITGTISPDEVLGRIFSQFCIGK